MSKGLIIGIIVFVLALAGIIGFVLVNRGAATPNAPVKLSELSDENSPQSLRDLMQVGSNQTCTFAGDEASSGTVYVGNGKMRGDFVNKTDSEIQTTHMIYDGTDIYMWFDGQEEGFKISFSDIEKFTDTGEDGQQTVDLDQSVSLNCGPWSIDNSLFATPDMKFTNFGEMLEGLQVMQEEPATTQCSACDQLPAEAATQCRAALGC